MSDNEIIKEVAGLDGFRIYTDDGGTCLYREGGTDSRMGFPSYLTSRDAIIPVIEKHKDHTIMFYRILKELLGYNEQSLWSPDLAMDFLTATPRQLCIALLKATGKYTHDPLPNPR